MQAHFDRHGRNEIINGSRSFDARAFNWASIGLNIPGFANGGSHLGGWRVVGERGWELEHTGPSRVVSNSDARSMLDNSQVVRGLERIEQRLATLERLTSRQTEHARGTEQTMRRLDKDGIKQRSETV
jgi:hypothetical protein